MLLELETFLLLKAGFLFGVNACVFIIMILFIVKNRVFIYVNAYEYIPMMLFLWLKIFIMGFYLVLMHMYIFI